MSILSLRARLSPQVMFLLLGVVSLLPYAYLLQFESLREHTVEFEYAFFAAFGLYVLATIRVLHQQQTSRWTLAWIFLVAALLEGTQLMMRPTLSDDMYRYVWDGRIQWQGISPYAYPPSATELAKFRDRQIWPSINRKDAVTVYPPAAEALYALLWRIWPDNVRGFQFAMGLGGLAAGWLVVRLLLALNCNPAWVLIYLWSPLLIFETAHSAHVDGLVLPFLVGAWLARLRERDTLVGILLGIATALKVYPAVLLPALWRPRHPQGRYRMPLAFLATVVVCYLPYMAASGTGVIGFLPKYFQEQFNIAPFVRLLLFTINKIGADPKTGLLLLTLAVLLVIGLWMVRYPAKDGETAIRRSVWLMGALALLSQDLFPWYLLWFLPLLAVFLRPITLNIPFGRRLMGIPFLRMDGWAGLWLFCGLAGLSYTFFIRWRPVSLAIWVQFLPVYLLLFIDLFHFSHLKLAARDIDVNQPKDRIEVQKLS
jgi:alpha-1,6-mannosyltransferase